ncbi:MAG: hypothetical protein EOO90_30805, partial [Pedobacter sp.]
PEKSKATAPVQQEVPQQKEKQHTAPKAKTIKRDKVKFPPPIVTQAYYSPSKYDNSTKKHTSLENKLIIINEKQLSYKNDFYGIVGADKIVTLKSAAAIKKYGKKAKFGAVEATGKSLKILNTPTDKIKFPPPTVKANATSMFSPLYRKDKETGEPILTETRLIIVNGKAIEDLSKFYGVYNANSVIYRTKAGSLSKYGEKGKNGAVEITGANVKYFTEITIPSTPSVEPPPPKQDQVKFPPPVVRPTNENLKNPPAREQTSSQEKVKRKPVKFPPPTVKRDQPTKSLKPTDQKKTASGNGIVREVLTSQSLIVTSLKPIPNNKDSAYFKANARDTYRVISYDEHTGKGSIELDWTLSPINNPPKMGQYNRGSEEYTRLGNLIEIEKRKNKKQKS